MTTNPSSFKLSYHWNIRMYIYVQLLLVSALCNQSLYQQHIQTFSVAYRMVCMLWSLCNVRDRLLALRLLPSKTNSWMILQLHPSDRLSWRTLCTTRYKPVSGFIFLQSFSEIFNRKEGRTYHLEGRVSSLWTQINKIIINPSLNGFVLVRTSERRWTKRRGFVEFCFIKEGLGGVVRVRHRTESCSKELTSTVFG